MLKKDDSLETLKEIDKCKLHILKESLGLKKIEDLINFYPCKYALKEKINKIRDINDNLLETEIEINGIIKNISKKKDKNGKMYLVCELVDNEKRILKIIWFKNIEKILKWLKEKEYVFQGKISKFKGKFYLIQPIISKKNIYETTIIPHYKSITECGNVNINSRFFRKIFDIVFKNLEKIEDYLPLEIINKYKLISYFEALKFIHKPKTLKDLNEARRRLKFDELFLLQLKKIYRNIEKNKNTHSFICKNTGLLKTFYRDILDIELTNGQKQVIKEIFNDINSGKMMNRLLQGDVGCGKTIVAFSISLIVAKSGYQTSIIVPTEVLAEQYFVKLKTWCKILNINMCVLTRNTNNKEREMILDLLNSGKIDIIIGTHSLLNEEIKYKNLGLVIIDEQHKFGVIQRANCIKTNSNNIKPHVLLMTATPIPRTLAMTLYDNYDISTINEFPTNRKPVKTVHIYENMRNYLLNFVKKEIEKGRQAYFIYPLIEKSEKINLKNVIDGHKELSMFFKGIETGIIHGKMDLKKKENIMNSFKKNEIQILAATTVVEVGIDVPNATIIVVENADRYGLSQLHQLRGRVGRWKYESFCFLITEMNIGIDSRKRIKALEKNSDGFKISELDLKLRGGGDIFGEKQSGEFKLRIADLNTDINILKAAKEEANKIIDKNASLEKYINLKNKINEDLNLSNIG